MNQNEEKPIQIQWVEKYRKELSQKRLKPVYVQWICTHKCNFRCDHCGTGAGDASPEQLTTAEILKVIDSLAELGCEIFSVTGGEPLLREDIFDVLDYAKSKNIKVGYVTNGFATDDYIQKIEKLMPHSILVSIDGYGKNHDEVRGAPGSYDKCINSVERYVKMGIPVVGVSTVMLPDNIEHIPKIIRDVQQRGCTKQRIQPLIPEGRAVGTKNPVEVTKQALKIVLQARRDGIDIDISEGFGFLGILDEKVRASKFFCGCGWNTFTIMQDGNVMGCPAIEYPDLGEGNVREKDIKDIWWNRFERFRDTILEDLPKKCRDCQYMEICRGGCWLFRANRADPCFLDVAEEVAKEDIISRHTTA